MKRFGVVLILLFAFFGLANSAYLAQHEISGTPLLCNIQNFSGCNVVTASQYSRLFGIPLAAYGVAFYVIVFILAALEIAVHTKGMRRLLQAAALFGVLASLYFTFVQAYLIGAFCIYCLTSALLTLFIFICAIFIEPLRANHPPPPSALPPRSPVSLRMPPPA